MVKNEHGDGDGDGEGGEERYRDGGLGVEKASLEDGGRWWPLVLDMGSVFCAHLEGATRPVVC